MMIENEDGLSYRDGRLTHGQLVRHYLPLARDRDVMFILWEMTPYPCWDPTEELERLARVCAPVRKRGWHRKLYRESARIYASIDAASRAFSQDDEPTEAAGAVDPHLQDSGPTTPRAGESSS